MNRAFCETGKLSVATLSRRDLLVTTAAIAAVQLPAWSLVPAAVRPIGDGAAAILAMFRDRPAAIQMGHAVLATLPPFGGRARVTAAILEDLSLTQSVTDRLTTDEIRARVSQRVRADFATGRTIMVDGWLLSVTEANLYALAALSEVLQEEP